MSTRALQVPRTGSQARAEGMSAEPLGAGGTGGLKGFGTGGIYSVLLLQLTSLFYIIIIRHWKF